MFSKMRHIRNTIGLRVSLGFGIILFLSILQGVVGNLGFDNAINGFSRYGQSQEGLREILSLERNVLDLQRGVLAYTYSGYGGLAERVKELRDNLSHQMAEAKSTIMDERRAKLLGQMDEQLRLYGTNFDAAIEERTLRDTIVDEHLEKKGKKAFQELEDLQRSLHQRGDIEGAALVSQAESQLALAQGDAIRFLLKPNSRLVQSTKQRLETLKSFIEKLKYHPSFSNNLDGIGRLSTLTHQFHQAFMSMVQATRAYMHLVYVVMGGEASRIGYLAQKLKEISLSEQDVLETNMVSSVHRIHDMTQGVSLLAALLSLILAWVISRNISLPIRAMTRALTSLARGKMAIEIPGKGRSDEIGSMAMAAHVFKEKAHELENASQYKSEFLANMSHELRTPLNSLLILAKLLANNEEGNLNSQQVDSAQVIHESGTDLLRLINDILDLSKVEAGRMDVIVEERKINQFGESIERLFKHVAGQKGLAFTVQIDHSLPAQLRTDWAKVEQILRNFLSNAFKFTREGAITIKIEPVTSKQIFMNSDLQPGHCLAMSVIDTGIGIPAEKQEQIFEAFRQADGTTSRQYGGTGLGLSISRKFSELVGGEIQVKSVEGEGSTFTLFLPRTFPKHLESSSLITSDAAGMKSATAPEVDASEHDFKDRSRTVLLVDDDKRNIFALKQILEQRVGSVLVASNGQEALNVLARENDIDLVLMDIMMPVMDGFQAMQEIRSQTRFSKLPILALTAKVMPGDREKCIQAGASDYLPKPVDGNKLVLALADWLSKAKAHDYGKARTHDTGKTRPHGTESQSEMAPPEPDAKTDYPRARILSDADPTVEAERLGTLQLGTPPVVVLIVDDDMRNTFSLAQALQKKADRILMAGDGIGALEKLKEEPDISVVLMDVMMPNMDGYEAMREIRKREAWRNLPMIALTAKAMPGDREKCLEAGADDYLSKPVDLKTLLEKIQKQLQSTTKTVGDTPMEPEVT